MTQTNSLMTGQPASHFWWTCWAPFGLPPVFILGLILSMATWHTTSALSLWDYPHKVGGEARLAHLSISWRGRLVSMLYNFLLRLRPTTSWGSISLDRPEICKFQWTHDKNRRFPSCGMLTRGYSVGRKRWVQFLTADSSGAGSWESCCVQTEQQMLIWMAFCSRYRRLLMLNGGCNYKMTECLKKRGFSSLMTFHGRTILFICLPQTEIESLEEWPENKGPHLPPIRPPVPCGCVISNSFFRVLFPSSLCICIFSTIQCQNCHVVV